MCLIKAFEIQEKYFWQLVLNLSIIIIIIVIVTVIFMVPADTFFFSASADICDFF